MDTSEKIKDYFAGIITHKLSKSELNACNNQVRRVRKNTSSMIARELKKITHALQNKK